MSPLTPAQRRELLRGFYGELEILDFVRDIYDDRHADRAEHECVAVPVPETFESFEHYYSVFFPLFLEETKAQLHRAKEQELGPCEQFRTDDFQILEESSGQSRWTLTRIQPLIAGFVYHRGEVVVVSERPVTPTDCADPGPAHLLGVVDEVVQGTLAVDVRVSLKSVSENKRFEERSRAVAERIAAGASWYVARLTSLATVSREYLGLMQLGNSRLVQTVLSGHQPEDATRFPIPHRLEETLKRSYNQYQLQAIEAARKEEGVTLVLGPPGTGKSHTILGVVSAVLARLEQPELKTDFARPKSLKEAVAAWNSTSSTSSTSGGQETASQSAGAERVAWMRVHALQYASVGKYRPWEDEYPLQLRGGHKDARSVYSTLSHSVVPVRKLHNVDQDDLLAGEGGCGSGSGSGATGKVLVCAPSNAAIDELVRRMVRVGIAGKDGELYVPRVTRLGPNIHPELAEYSFGRQVEQRAARLGGELRKIKNAILREAEIIAATLSVAGSADLAEWQIDTVVVDEAGQGVELSTLIPLQLNCKRLVLVGDHKQLPATVFSLQAQESGYSRSMFQRLIQLNPQQARMLKIQFRMHPEISLFPAQVFYDGELEDAKNIMQLVGDPAWHSQKQHPRLNLGPVAFYDVEQAVEESVGQSLVNREEAEVVVKLVLTMMKLYPSHRWREKIAIISPYAEQVKLLRSRLKDIFNAGKEQRSGSSSHRCPIEVNTVDGFQGREKDVVIVSTVRSRRLAQTDAQAGLQAEETGMVSHVKNLHDLFTSDSSAHKFVETKSIGFLRDARRMNVMFTRARQCLWVVGHWTTLLNDPLWADFLDYVSDQRRLRVKPDTFVGLGRLDEVCLDAELEPEAGAEAEAAAGAEAAAVQTGEEEAEPEAEAEIADTEHQNVDVDED